MFWATNNFNRDIGRWNVSQVTDMRWMFEVGIAFDQDISGWRGPAAESAQGNMFQGATAFQARFSCTNAVTGPASSCVGPTPIPDASWHTFVAECLAESAAKPVYGEVTGECIDWARSKDVWYGTMPNWDTSLVTDMSGWNRVQLKDQGFRNRFPTFNGDISKWETGKVTDMGHMFRGCSLFNQDIGGWNTAQVTIMYAMFHSAYAFNQDIGSWNTSQVINMYGMFWSASAFNQDIGRWNTENVTNGDDVYGVYGGMRFMFKDASAFNHDISSWTGSAATSTQTDMFIGAHAFQVKFKCSDVNSGPVNSCVIPDPTD
jgi:surface protein